MTDHILDSISYRLYQENVLIEIHNLSMAKYHYQENILIEIQNLIMEKYEFLSDTLWVVKVTKCM